MEPALELQLAELKHLQESSLAIWQMYTTWFNWFIGISLAGVGWFASHSPVNQPYIVPLSIFMIGASGLGLLLAFSLFAYDRKARRRAIQLALSPQGAEISRTVGEWVSLMTGLLIIGALTGNAALWAYLGFWLKNP